jgi:hypothetical protein
MHCKLVARAVLGTIAIVLSAGPELLLCQERARTDALAAVVEAMFIRRGALGDSLPFDACSVYENSGRPEGFPDGVLAGLRPLLDRQVPDPCSVPKPSEGGRHERLVRVDSVVVSDSAARVHLHVRRGEWSYEEVYYLTSRDAETRADGWSFREVRMYPPVHTTARPRLR